MMMWWWYDIIIKPGSAHDRKDSKEDVPGGQKTSQLERASLGHVCLHHDDNVHDDDGDDGDPYDDDHDDDDQDDDGIVWDSWIDVLQNTVHHNYDQCAQ